MPLAAGDTAGFAPARYLGNEIPEKGLASKPLSGIDCHFGLNGDVASIVTDTKVSGYGPRAIDMAARGGIVAETLWEEYQHSSTASSALKGFLLTFDDIGSAKALKKWAYPTGAKISKEDVGGQEKYIPTATNKTMATITEEYGEGSLHQLGARWSKVAIEQTVRNKGTVHFHLDGMGEIADIVGGHGDFSHNVTSRELRYVYRNRGRKELMGSVIFYNGFQKTGLGYQAVIVDCPWN
ncbi:hypothetical protein [Roseococcus sp. YIM B11640]|uniref:hypothetical protein n=1 Tax=Roseococcus sp. YIM B11640 TaxID=3133973 RepID=UPI003C7C7D05